MRHLRAAIAAALLSTITAVAASGQVAHVPQVINSGGSSVPSIGALLIDSSGVEKGTPANPLVVTGSGSGGGDPSWTATNGSAPAGNTLGLVGGWDGTNAHRFLTDSAGRSLVTIYSMPAITGTVSITGTPSVAQSGSWSVGITNFPSSFAVSNFPASFQISGQLPAFASPPTVNLGTLNGAATYAGQQSILTALGSPYQQGGALPLPAGAATAARQDSLLAAVGSPYQAGGPLPLPTGAAADASVQAVTAAINGTPAVKHPDVFATGTIASGTANAAYTAVVSNGAGVAGFTVTGLTASGATLAIETSNDKGSTWTGANGLQGATGTLFSSVAADGQFRVNVGGRTAVRLRVSSVGSGTINVVSNISLASTEVALASPLPAGTNAIGGVTLADGADQTLGSKTDAAATTTDTTPTSLMAQVKQAVGQLKLAVSALNGATPAGTNTIGSVTGWASTTPLSQSVAAGATVYLPSSGTWQPAPAWASYYRCRVSLSPQTYNMFIQETPDGSTITTPRSAMSVAAGAITDLNIPVLGYGQARGALVNTSGTAGTFVAACGFTAN